MTNTGPVIGCNVGDETYSTEVQPSDYILYCDNLDIIARRRKQKIVIFSGYNITMRN